MVREQKRGRGRPRNRRLKALPYNMIHEVLEHANDARLPDLGVRKIFGVDERIGEPRIAFGVKRFFKPVDCLPDDATTPRLDMIIIADWETELRQNRHGYERARDSARTGSSPVTRTW